MNSNDTSDIDLSRYVSAHQQSYSTALAEIKSGKKLTHWMWYIFPQLCGLGLSDMSKYYALKSIKEAEAFLSDSYLGHNLTEISRELLLLEINNATEVFGRPDDMKLRSCLTLFAEVAGDQSVFHKVLDKYFNGMPDKKLFQY